MVQGLVQNSGKTNNIAVHYQIAKNYTRKLIEHENDAIDLGFSNVIFTFSKLISWKL